MTEEEAKDWISARFGAVGLKRMEMVAALVRAEASRQNLIAASTLDAMWSRHIVDSAQLVAFAVDVPGLWLDIGTGAGFPGLVIAALTDRQMICAEPRKRRADFLLSCVKALHLESRVTVIAEKVERVQTVVAVISGRAVASLSALFGAAQQCSTWNTLWLLPKGQSATQEIETARQTWHGKFHVEHSVTDEESRIVVAKEVSRR